MGRGFEPRRAHVFAGGTASFERDVHDHIMLQMRLVPTLVLMFVCCLHLGGCWWYNGETSAISTSPSNQGLNVYFDDDLRTNPPAINASEEFEILVTVLTGSLTVPSGIRVRLRIEDDLGDLAYQDEQTLGGLDANTALEQVWIVPGLNEGAYTIEIELDYDDAVNESNEFDNTDTRNLTINPATLMLTDG